MYPVREKILLSAVVKKCKLELFLQNNFQLQYILYVPTISS